MTDTTDETIDSAEPGAASAGTTIKDGFNAFAKQAADKARDAAHDGKARAGNALDEMARLMEGAAATVDERLGESYGKYARSAAEGISSFSQGLKDADVDDLVDRAQQFVRKSPAVAVGIAAALGFVVARLVKAGIDGDAPDRSDPAADA